MKPLLVLLLLTLTACGVRPTDPIEGGPAPTEEMAPGTVLYFLEGATLARVVRLPTAENSLEVLAKGPTPRELAHGLTTEIPPSASPITAIPGTNGITVRISSQLKYLSPLAQSQLVCTAIPPDQPRTPVTLKDPTETLAPQQCPFKA